MKKTVIMWMILAVLFSACGEEGNNGMDGQNMSSQVSDNTCLSENYITVSEEGIIENAVSKENMGESMPDYDSEPDPQDTFMIRVEGNISENQAWVDFLKGEMPDYTGMDFSDRRFAGLNRPYTLQDMEEYSLDLEAYGVSIRQYAADGGQLTGIQIFPYDVDADGEEELLFICDSYAGLVKLWVLDEAYEDTWCLYPSASNWVPPGIPGRAVWLWSDGYICYQGPDSYKGCPEYICIYSEGNGEAFELKCNQYWSSDMIVVYYYTYEDVDGYSTVKVMFNRNGKVIDGSLIHAGNVCPGAGYNDDLAIITQIYEETVGDAVPVRELTGLKGTEDGVIIVTREEFYSGAYLK